MGLKAPQKYYLTLRRLDSCPESGRAHDTFKIDRTGLAPLQGAALCLGRVPGLKPRAKSCSPFGAEIAPLVILVPLS